KSERVRPVVNRCLWPSARVRTSWISRVVQGFLPVCYDVEFTGALTVAANLAFEFCECLLSELARDQPAKFWLEQRLLHGVNHDDIAGGCNRTVQPVQRKAAINCLRLGLYVWLKWSIRNAT